MKIVILLTAVLVTIVSCQNSSSSDPGNASPTITNTVNISPDNWSATELSDLPGRPTVMISANYDSAQVVLRDDQGQISVTEIKMENEQVKMTAISATNIGVLKKVQANETIETHFHQLKERLVRNHELASSRCRFSQSSAEIANDSYNSRGSVLLKLKGAWSDRLTGIEVAIALDPETGDVEGFTVLKTQKVSSARSFFSVPNEWVLAGPKGQAVREYDMWISICDEAYGRIKRNNYKPSEKEKMDKDASALIDLEIRNGTFKNQFYETDEIALDELN